MSPGISASPGDIPSSAPGDPQSSGAGDGSSTEAGDVASSKFRNSLREVDLRELKQETSTSNGADLPAQLSEGLRKLLPFIDQEAMEMLWNECRSRCIDCSPEEILEFVKAKGKIALNGTIQNPTGFLLRAVPKCFEGNAFASYRDDRNRRREEDRKRQEQEQNRLKQLEEQGREEAETYEQDKELLESLSPEDYRALYDRAKHQIITRYPNSLKSAPNTVEDLVHEEMIKILTQSAPQPAELHEIRDGN
jgi:hypothetical protein